VPDPVDVPGVELVPPTLAPSTPLPDVQAPRPAAARKAAPRPATKARTRKAPTPPAEPADAVVPAGAAAAPRRRRPATTVRFGIDIGGTGIKGAPVDLATGQLVGERVRIETPQPPTCEAVADTVAAVVAGFSWTGAVGCTFPGVVQHGVTRTAANLDPSWIDTDTDALFTARLGQEVHLLNDADAAGLAEVRYGAARDVPGTVILVTIGTGLGTAVFIDGTLLPNTELGHLEVDGHDAETRASERARIEGELSWKKFARRFDTYLAALERYLVPDLFVLGGGGAKKADKFLDRLERTTEIRLATLGNDAGIVGAAMSVGGSAPDGPRGR
jgi:polyphosphate glucokinase